MKFKYSEDEVTEMDTVKGVRESGKRLLTMIFRKKQRNATIPDARWKSRIRKKGSGLSRDRIGNRCF